MSILRPDRRKDKPNGLKRSPVKKRRTGKPRRGRVVDKAQLSYIAAQPCWITGERPVTVHHVRRSGEPKSDKRTLPLIARLHMLTHERPGEPCIERGKKVFERFWGVDIEDGVKKYQQKFERSGWKSK